MQVVWFKRDLRINDHAALLHAAEKGPLLPLYILEKALWEQADLSQRHYLFLSECLKELDHALQALGQGLIIKIGDAVEVLDALHQRHGITTLWSHQETWNHWTYDRDIAVAKWAKSHAITWHEPSQHGVIRRLKNRDGWASRWYAHMKKPMLSPPKNLVSIDETSTPLPTAQALGLTQLPCPKIQKGGRESGLRLLHSFLHTRGEAYTKAMSAPITAFRSCSRLSPHLAFGTLSIRELFHAAEKRKVDISNRPPGTRGKWPSAVKSFHARLRWHCHFIQKLEDEPRIEFENMHPAYDALKKSLKNEFSQTLFLAWKEGKTGYPMIDACMRALTCTGWLNFRMRAMLMSFASYHLWLPWREPALHLARLFTDYEPGIHYSQVQMQSGTTGINSIRIYNPIKQGIEHDPDGLFIRKWIPELANMPQQYIHTPWEAPEHLNDYPAPIIDEKTQRKAAADILYSLRKDSDHKIVAKKIVKKHASRKQTKKKKKVKNNRQGELPL